MSGSMGMGGAGGLDMGNDPFLEEQRRKQQEEQDRKRKEYMDRIIAEDAAQQRMMRPRQPASADSAGMTRDPVDQYLMR